MINYDKSKKFLKGISSFAFVYLFSHSIRWDFLMFFVMESMLVHLHTKEILRGYYSACFHTLNENTCSCVYEQVIDETSPKFYTILHDTKSYKIVENFGDVS